MLNQESKISGHKGRGFVTVQAIPCESSIVQIGTSKLKHRANSHLFDDALVVQGFRLGVSA